MSKVTIQFIMSKGEGCLPDISSIPEDKRNSEFIRSCMKFCEDFMEVEDYIESWKILDDGLEKIIVDEDYTISGYPSPIVEYILKDKIDPEEFKQGVWMSRYRLMIPECDQDEPFYFEDRNGYTSVIDVERV
jgi:hypothetical protein